MPKKISFGELQTRLQANGNALLTVIGGEAYAVDPLYQNDPAIKSAEEFCNAAKLLTIALLRQKCGLSLVEMDERYNANSKALEKGIFSIALGQRDRDERIQKALAHRLEIIRLVQIVADAVERRAHSRLLKKYEGDLVAWFKNEGYEENSMIHLKNHDQRTAI